MGPAADKIFAIIVLGGLAVWVLWGWWAWMRSRPLILNVRVVFSLVGFSLASLSAGLEIGSGTYAHGFALNYLTLLRIYIFGFWSALLGLVCSLIGVASRSPLRFKAPALSLVLVLLWMAHAMGG
jgi:hypothetical protein